MAHTVVPSVNVFVVRDGKVVLGRRANTGWMDGQLCPPGGHVEAGETPTIAALREVKEELAMDLQPKDLEFLCVAARNGSPEYVAYEFIVRNPRQRPANAEPEKCSELAWVDPEHLPDDVVPQFAEIIRRSIVGTETYLEVGYE